MPEDEIECCETCKWHEDFSGACCNGESEARGDFTTGDDYCGCWEPRTE